MTGSSTVGTSDAIASASETRLTEEAAEIVKGVEEAEDAALLPIMSLLRENSTLPPQQGNVILTSVSEAEVGPSMVALLTQPAPSASAAQGAAKLQLANSSVMICIPLAVVAQVRIPAPLPRHVVGAIVVATRFREEGAALFTTQESTLLEPPLSLRVLAADGENHLEGVPLAEPIVIRLQEVRTPGAVCAYLDEDTGAWRRDGIVEVQADGDPGLYCHTSHLTIFAPILESVGYLVACSQAHLMSESGLRSVSRGTWCVTPAAVFYWFMLLLQGALCILAVKWDKKATDKETWEDSMLLTDNVAYKKADSFVESAVQQVEGLLDLDFLTRFCTYRALAHSMKVTAVDVEQIVKGSRRARASDMSLAGFHHLAVAEKSPSIAASVSTCPSTPDHRNRMSVKSAWDEVSEPNTDSSAKSLAEMVQKVSSPSVEGRLALKICDEAVSIVEDFWQCSFWVRTWIIFSAEHPWIQTNYFSITKAALTRALLLSAQVMGSMMLNAAFFVNTSDAFSPESSEECQPESLLDRLKWNITVGIISSLFCYLPLCGIASVLCARQFVYKDHWDDQEKKQFLRSWRMRDVVLWLVVVLYVVWSIFFTVLFLANVSFKSGLHWTVASLSNFIRDFFLMPLAIAGLLNVLATLAHYMRPSLVRRVRKEFKILRAGRHCAEGSCDCMHCSCYGYRAASMSTGSVGKSPCSSRSLSAVVPSESGASSKSWKRDFLS